MPSSQSLRATGLAADFDSSPLPPQATSAPLPSDSSPLPELHPEAPGAEPEAPGEPSENPEGARVSVLDHCPKCQAVLDVSALNPLSETACPSCGETMRVLEHFSHFVLTQQIGRGGMGVVMRARDSSLDRPVALKLLRHDLVQDTALMDRLRDEAQVLASINHSNVVRVFSAGMENGLYFIEMEILSGGSLAEAIRKQGQFPEQLALSVVLQVAEGLNAAYSRGLLHRDVKPGNILFASPEAVKVVDFGLAMPITEAAENLGEVWGTPYYVAPERLQGSSETVSSDIYALGATLFHCLAARPPFEAKTAMAVAQKHVDTRPPSVKAFAPSVSGATAYVIARMLEKDPAKRYRDYDELMEHLRYAETELNNAVPRARAAATTSPSAKPPTTTKVPVNAKPSLAAVAATRAGAAPKSQLPVQPVAPPPWKHPLVLTAAAAIVGVAILIIAWPSSKSQGGPLSAGSTSLAGVSIPSMADRRCIAARGLFANSKFAPAAAAFHDLEGADLATVTLRNSVALHEALAYLILGKKEAAQTVFSGMVSRLASAQTGENAMYFEVAKWGASTARAPKSVGSQYDDSSDEAFGLFALGIISYENGDMSGAIRYLEKFNGGLLQERSEWLGQYRSLAQQRIAQARNTLAKQGYPTQFWFRADALDASSTNQWTDLSGKGANIVPISAPPSLAANRFNGHPAAHFDAAQSQALQFPRPVQDDFTILFVFAATDLVTGDHFFDGQALVSGEVKGELPDFGVAIGTGGSIRAGTGQPDVNVKSREGFNDGNPHIVSFSRIRSTGVVELWVDGVHEDKRTGGKQALTAPSNLALGAVPAGSNWLNGDIAEVKIFDEALPDNARQEEEKQFMTKYGVVPKAAK